ncbi:uncharacterized protein [Triticum aestivum]|uniref:uncharacterized protein isoform X2 n=1 Tax=Triticum aestivum TaxID=4565 RepID=UPI001D0071B8|nr:uncharacterized protein LOC123077945 isoform X2 [Triticum aestivum]XP_044356264.1 uncharacterized protein LOC123077945 isoform X2 [Triticum aestivum]
METAAPWSRWLHTMAAVSRERAWRWCEGRRPRSSWQPCHACSVLPRLAANVTGGAAAVHDCFGSSEWALRMFDCHANAKVIELGICVMFFLSRSNARACFASFQYYIMRARSSNGANHQHHAPPKAFD